MASKLWGLLGAYSTSAAVPAEKKAVTTSVSTHPLNICGMQSCDSQYEDSKVGESLLTAVLQWEGG